MNEIDPTPTSPAAEMLARLDAAHLVIAELDALVPALEPEVAAQVYQRAAFLFAAMIQFRMRLDLQSRPEDAEAFARVPPVRVPRAA